MRCPLPGLRAAAILAVVCLAAWAPAAAQDSRNSAEIRIGLPGSADRAMSIEPGVNSIVLDLPRGSVFPLDFEAATGGLVRGGEAEQGDGERVRLELELTRGVLERVVYDPDGVMLRFSSRYAGTGVSDDPAESYTLGAGDRIELKVHNHPELSAELTVDRDGSITAPEIGLVEAAGLSTRQLAGRVTELLARSYLVDPQVDVDVVRFRSQWVMVAGEVRDPGRIALMGGTRLKEVLGDAGGFTEIAGEEIVISRKSSDGTRSETIRVPRIDFESGADDPRLRHGDFIEVMRARFCYVQGEVRRPDRVLIERGTTLLQAITMVGGLTDWADRKAVRVLIGDPPERVEKVVNLRRVQVGKDPDLELRGGEIIVVNRRFF